MLFSSLPELVLTDWAVIDLNYINDLFLHIFLHDRSVKLMFTQFETFEKFKFNDKT